MEILKVRNIKTPVVGLINTIEIQKKNSLHQEIEITQLAKQRTNKLKKINIQISITYIKIEKDLAFMPFLESQRDQKGLGHEFKKVFDKKKIVIVSNLTKVYTYTFVKVSEILTRKAKKINK